jgi:hypothetical protein
MYNGKKCIGLTKGDSIFNQSLEEELESKHLSRAGAIKLITFTELLFLG